MDPMRDLSVSDSRSDSSSSPPPSSGGGLTAQTLWPQNLGDSSFQFSSMMYNPITSQISSQTNSTSTTPLHPTSSNTFDFATAQQQYLYQSAAAASYNPWAYQAAYSFPYQGMYGSTADHGGFKDVTIPSTTRSSAASTPTATMTLPWAITHEGKKKRQPYKKDQISRLEYEYTVNQYLTNKRRADLSAQLSLDEKQVKVWFQNRRMKDKKLKQRISGPFPLGAPMTPCIERLIN